MFKNRFGAWFLPLFMVGLISLVDYVPFARASPSKDQKKELSQLGPMTDTSGYAQNQIDFNNRSARTINDFLSWLENEENRTSLEKKLNPETPNELFAMMTGGDAHPKTHMRMFSVQRSAGKYNINEVIDEDSKRARNYFDELSILNFSHLDTLTNYLITKANASPDMPALVAGYPQFDSLWPLLLNMRDSMLVYKKKLKERYARLNVAEPNLDLLAGMEVMETYQKKYGSNFSDRYITLLNILRNNPFVTQILDGMVGIAPRQLIGKDTICQIVVSTPFTDDTIPAEPIEGVVNSSDVNIIVLQGNRKFLTAQYNRGGKPEQVRVYPLSPKQEPVLER